MLDTKRIKAMKSTPSIVMKLFMFTDTAAKQQCIGLDLGFRASLPLDCISIINLYSCCGNGNVGYDGNNDNSSGDGEVASGGDDGEGEGTKNIPIMTVCSRPV